MKKLSLCKEAKSCEGVKKGWKRDEDVAKLVEEKGEDQKVKNVTNTRK